MFAFDSDEDRAALERIGSRIGYGRSCQILGELWDDMFERRGLPRGRGRMEKRADMERTDALTVRIAELEQDAVPSEDAIRATVEEVVETQGFDVQDAHQGELVMAVAVAVVQRLARQLNDA